ncbi:hypothetical protein F5X68DRAFT_228969 [Plectosphaerella plurivora]|uniref:Uncharacterized protein n=1 Tax=Plectosphaerella plurivora TaxID=936078 RepID=A0A9P9AEB4_9PEZI|nr:hypothetical protein F5X68DRAFT_228969 [Plectosphaerella plurivora]
MFALSGTQPSHAANFKDEASGPTNTQNPPAVRSYGTYVRSLLSQDSRLVPLDQALQARDETSRTLTIVEFGTSSGTTAHGNDLEEVLRKIDDMKKDDPLSDVEGISEMLLQLNVDGLDSTHILFELAQSPARVVVDEWTFYALLMWRCIKSFEFSQASGKLAQVPGRSIDEETSDYIKDLHRWCRRGEQTIFKLETLKRFLQQCPNNQGNNKLRDLLQDVEHLMTQIQQYKVLLETKVPILMSVVQLMDSQRAAKEAIHVKQLTVVAIVFLPLSYVAALFMWYFSSLFLRFKSG